MRSWILAAVAVGVVAVSVVGLWIVRPGGEPRVLRYYRLVDEDTLIVGTETTSGEEIRVTEVVESADAVTITVRGFTVIFGPTAPVGVPVELRVDLDAPLGNRAVFDPHHDVPRR